MSEGIAVTLTREQRERIIEDAWSGVAKCPADGADMQVRLAEMVNGDYRLEASCPRCRLQMIAGRGDDPRRASFRAWHHEEMNAMVDSVLQGQVPTCPNCKTGVGVSETKASEGTNIELHCMRCGESAVTTVARGR